MQPNRPDEQNKLTDFSKQPAEKLKQKNRMMVRNSSLAKIGIGTVIVVGALLFAHWLDRDTFAEELAMSQSTIEQVFPSSSKCKRCHERVFEEWETSPLSRSIHSPAFRASLDAFLSSQAGKDKAVCFRCHAPHVREFPAQVQLFIDQAKAGDHMEIGRASCRERV